MNWSSIRTKLIVGLIIAALVPSVATMIISYSYTTHSLKERAVQDNGSLLFQGSENIKNYLEELNRNSLSVYSDDFFYRSLPYGFENISARGQQVATLQSMAAASKDVLQIYLYVDKKRQATLLTPSSLKRMSDIDSFIPGNWNNELALTLSSPHAPYNYGFDVPPVGSGDQKVITLYRSIRQIPSDNQLGLLAMDIRLDAISRISNQLFQAEHEKLYLLDENGYVIYSGEPERIGQKFSAPWYQARVMDGTTRGSFEEDKQIFVYDTVDTAFSKWRLVKQIPASYLTRDTQQAAAINVLLLAASLLLIIAMIILISVSLTKPIKRLVWYMNQIQTGHLTVDIETNRKDEIGVVYRRLSSMMDTINNLILREYKLKLANTTNQLRALQAQVNPHFLNNSLQSIGSLALEHGVKRVYSLISTLSRMMRYSMYNTDEPVALDKELQHVKDYMELQAERFDQGFKVRYDVDKTTLDVLVPKMILQPLVENYFKHGRDPMEESSQIILTSLWIDASTLQLTVEDNGNGMPEEVWQRLQQRLEQAAQNPVEGLSDPSRSGEDEGGIGLVNVMTRLKLFYGEDSHFEVENLQPHGFRAILTMRVEGEPE